EHDHDSLPDARRIAKRENAKPVAGGIRVSRGIVCRRAGGVVFRAAFFPEYAQPSARRCARDAAPGKSLSVYGRVDAGGDPEAKGAGKRTGAAASGREGARCAFGAAE